MSRGKRGRFLRVIFFSCFLIGAIFILSGCSSPPKMLDRSISGPQVIVNPECIRLGVVKLRDTNIVFEGSGFKPGDSIFIALLGPNQTQVIVAEASIQPDGQFRASVPPLTKVMEILRADIIFDETFQNIVVISQPPIAEGVYTVKVTSMLSKLTAETKLAVKGPTIIDSLKDWIGKLTGKIQHKKTK